MNTREYLAQEFHFHICLLLTAMVKCDVMFYCYLVSAGSLGWLSTKHQCLDTNYLTNPELQTGPQFF